MFLTGGNKLATAAANLSFRSMFIILLLKSDIPGRIAIVLILTVSPCIAK